MFNRSFAECATVFDFIVSISEHTALQIRKLFKKHDLRQLPISVVPLGHAMLRQPSLAHHRTLPAALQSEISDNYVLCVGTVECRKNHNYLFQVWRALIENPNLPQLLIVGRIGWRVQDFVEQIDLTNGLNGKIKILTGVSDAELELLYKGCQFTIFPSFVEGWGLPVGESLWHGKLCLASSTSAIPEVGGALVDYIDPLDATSCIRSVRNIIDDGSYLSKREADIAKSFNIRPWKQTTQLLQQQVIELANTCRQHRHDAFIPTIPLKCQIGAGEQGRPDAPIDVFASALQGVIFQSGWYWPEPWGRWMAGENAVIRLKVAEIEELRIYLQLAVVSHAENNQVVLSANGHIARHPARGHFRNWIAIDALPDQDGLVEIKIHVDGCIQSPDGVDPRQISIGIVKFTAIPLSDSAARLKLTESIMFFS